jgi:hypothetical protein
VEVLDARRLVKSVELDQELPTTDRERGEPHRSAISPRSESTDGAATTASSTLGFPRSPLAYPATRFK